MGVAIWWWTVYITIYLKINSMKTNIEYIKVLWNNAIIEKRFNILFIAHYNLFIWKIVMPLIFQISFHWNDQRNSCGEINNWIYYFETKILLMLRDKFRCCKSLFIQNEVFSIKYRVLWVFGFNPTESPV